MRKFRNKRFPPRSMVRSRQENKKGQYILLVLTLIATWILAFTGFYSAVDTSRKMKEQIEEFDRANTIQYRPIIHPVLKDLNWKLFLNYHDQDGWHMRNNMDRFSDLESTDSISISFELDHEIDLYNVGKTPLIYGKKFSGVMSESRWNGDFKKDVRIFANYFDVGGEEEEEKDNYTLDKPLLPESTFTTSRIEYKYTLGSEDWKELGKDRFLTTLYSFIYIPYKDFNERDYSLLMIMHYEFVREWEKAEDVTVFKLRNSGLEKYVDNFHTYLKEKD